MAIVVVFNSKVSTQHTLSRKDLGEDLELAEPLVFPRGKPVTIEDHKIAEAVLKLPGFDTYSGAPESPAGNVEEQIDTAPQGNPPGGDAPDATNPTSPGAGKKGPKGAGTPTEGVN